MPCLQIAIHGAAGRMGKRLVALGADDPQLNLVAALEAPDHPLLGQDAGVLAGGVPLGVALSSEITVPVDVVIDFSVPRAAEKIIETCRAKRIPLVVATTGFEPEQLEKLRSAAKDIPLLWSPSMSMAVNLSMKLCEVAGKVLADKDADLQAAHADLAAFAQRAAVERDSMQALYRTEREAAAAQVEQQRRATAAEHEAQVHFSRPKCG